MRALAALLLVGLISPLLHGQIPTVIFSNIASDASSDVPGLLGFKFNAGTATQFERPFSSPDGNRWIFRATVQDTTDFDVIITGTGNTSAGATLLLREGTTSFFDGARTYTAFGNTMGINNAGQYAFSGTVSAPTTSDSFIGRWNGGGFDLIAQEGSAAAGQGVGIGYGSINDSAHILNNGDVRFRSASLTGATTQQVLYNHTGPGTGTVLVQTDTTVPAGQLDAGVRSVDVLGANRFRSSANGAAHIWQGDLNGTTTDDNIMVVNGTVVAQEGFVLPGSGFASNVGANFSADAGSQQISSSGAHTIFRGPNADAIDWVARNGAVVAQTDAAIFTGSLELFDDAPFAATFFLNVVNNNGDYVVGGTTNNANANTNAVLVLNGLNVIAREGDAVDVNGNGLFDDNAFLSVFNNDDAFLTDDLRLFFTADLRDGAGTSIGQAFMTMNLAAVPEPATFILGGLGLGAAGMAGYRRVRQRLPRWARK